MELRAPVLEAQAFDRRLLADQADDEIPASAVSCRRTMTRSPGMMPAPVMLSPRTRSAKSASSPERSRTGM